MCARINAENIINKTDKKIVRTDDIGKVNDQHHDHYTIDKYGNIIEKSQMKFVGKDADAAFKNLKSKDCEKYINDPIDMSSEMAEDIKAKAIQEAQKFYK